MTKYRVETHERFFDVEASRVDVKEGFVLFAKYDPEEGREREVALFPVGSIQRVLDLEKVTQV